MSDSQIIKNMIAFIEDKEKEALAASKAGANSKAKSKVVGDILKELEREIKDADKKH